MVFHQLWPNNPITPGSTTSGGFIEVNNCLIWCSTARKVAGSTLRFLWDISNQKLPKSYLVTVDSIHKIWNLSIDEYLQVNALAAIPFKMAYDDKAVNLTMEKKTEQSNP